MLKTLTVMLIAITAGAVGDIFLTQGMKGGGDLSTMTFRQITATAIDALTNWRLVLGTALQAVYFGLWLAVLSWEDLSVALPLQALSYLVVAFLAQCYLGENVTGIRWTGICLICIGVALVTRSSVVQ
ncbi:MAG: EamA family transporter [Desulfuromonadaceae bacterium]|nr:EamA family transporter [Desulfuromonadaceae bacterium]MDD2855307.1 EamA family transporter [Desulfuromonadaceae bacterium]